MKSMWSLALKHPAWNSLIPAGMHKRVWSKQPKHNSPIQSTIMNRTCNSKLQIVPACALKMQILPGRPDNLGQEKMKDLEVFSVQCVMPWHFIVTQWDNTVMQALWLFKFHLLGKLTMVQLPLPHPTVVAGHSHPNSLKPKTVLAELQEPEHCC